MVILWRVNLTVHLLSASSLALMTGSDQDLILYSAKTLNYMTAYTFTSIIYIMYIQKTSLPGCLCV